MDKAIKRCERKEYQELLTLLNDAFEYGADSKWFQQNMGHCTPYEELATDEDIANHWIMVADGKLAASVGAYPFEWVIAEDAAGGGQVAIRAFGIGQVSCAKAYRGNGLMTELLRHAIGEMTAEGAYVAFLGGDRFRYNRFGFDFAGNKVVFLFVKARFERLADCSGLQVKLAGPDDSEELNLLYETLPSYVKRDKRAWEKQLTRNKHYRYIGYKDGKSGYIATTYHHDRIEETAGDPEVVKALILHTMRQFGLEEMRAAYPHSTYRQDSLLLALWRSASEARQEPVDLVALYEPDQILTSLSPLISRQWPEQELQSLDPHARGSLLAKLFGFAAEPLAPELSGLAQVRPIVAWIAEPDNI